jgi:hypothetical protein
MVHLPVRHDRRRQPFDVLLSAEAQVPGEKRRWIYRSAEASDTTAEPAFLVQKRWAAQSTPTSPRTLSHWRNITGPGSTLGGARHSSTAFQAMEQVTLYRIVELSAVCRWRVRS